MENIRRVEKHGLRHYEVTSEDGNVIGVFPSITTVLGETSDKSGLEKWKKRVGEAEAKRIGELSMNRGTVMHRLVELYKATEGDKSERLNALKEVASTDEETNQYSEEENGALWLEEGWKMFMKFYFNSSQYFDRVAKVIAAESFLWSKVGYAGTVDNVSEMTDGRTLVIDYKNSRRPKREDWVQDYFVQGSAYFIAHWERTGQKPDGVEIWIANEEQSIPQTFSLTISDVKYYFAEFQRRLKLFNEKYP
jgi:genome maintenance exonuclease 1